MRTIILLSILASGLVHTSSPGQGTFVYDQQSADETSVLEGGVHLPAGAPAGQSFTPSLSAVGFIRLYLYDAVSPHNGVGGTFQIRLLSDSITGTEIASTYSVALPDGFIGPVDFFFSTPAPVTPGTLYFFSVTEQGQEDWLMNWSHYNYPRGNGYQLGLPSNIADLWFREGIVVPEPGSFSVIVTASILVTLRRRTATARTS